MAEERKKVRKARIAARVGKNTDKAVDTAIDSSKYRAGGAAMRGKKGGTVRKPIPKIRYKRTHGDKKD